MFNPFELFSGYRKQAANSVDAMSNLLAATVRGGETRELALKLKNDCVASQQARIT